jgi:hypothetical protein
LPGIGPGRTPGHEVNLLKNMAHDLIGLVLFAQLIQLGHHSRERSLDVADGALGVVLALRVETALATNEFFSVKIGKRMQDAIARRRRICQEAGQAVPQRWHLPRFRKV